MGEMQAINHLRGRQAAVDALARRRRQVSPFKSRFDHVVYALTEGRARSLYVGTYVACAEYIGRNPRGPWGGSTHMRFINRQYFTIID